MFSYTLKPIDINISEKKYCSYIEKLFLKNANCYNFYKIECYLTKFQQKCGFNS